jgi:hypothetical protein
MFKKPIRDKLRKHGWLEVAKEGGNESQSWRRTKDNVTTAISDMRLLYNKLPQDKREELFNLQNFKDLFDILIYPINLSDLVKLEIANYLVSKSILLFQSIHRGQNENTRTLSSVVNDYLKKAIEICNDITYRERLDHINNNNLPKEGLTYLASWNEIVDREENNLRSFISDLIDKLIGEIYLEMSYDKKEISGKVIEYYTSEPYDMRLTISDTKDRADLLISNENGFKATQQFIVKSYNYDYLLYYRTSEIEKIK